MGEAAYKDDKQGPAVAYMTIASSSLQGVWVPSPGSPLAKFSKEIDESKDDIEHVKRAYAMENNHIYFQKVPEANQLEISEGKSMFTAQAWMPPQPAFSSIT